MNIKIDSNRLRALLKDFHTLTHMRVVVFDANINEISSYPNMHSEYCRILRENPNLNEKCFLCDKEACTNALKTKSTYSYKCHAGLLEAVTPVMHGNTVIGFIMLGQVLQTDKIDESWNEIFSYLKKYDLDIEKVKKAYYKKKNLSPEIISSASNIMKACARYLYYTEMISLQHESLEWVIDKYIKEHLSEELNAEILCEHFLISKNRLYEISNHLYSCGIATIIRKFRIDEAKKLLAATDYKINEIAAKCGIPDYNYFTKIFKAHTDGMLPSDYIKLFRK